MYTLYSYLVFLVHVWIFKSYRYDTILSIHCACVKHQDSRVVLKTSARQVPCGTLTGSVVVCLFCRGSLSTPAMQNTPVACAVSSHTHTYKSGPFPLLFNTLFWTENGLKAESSSNELCQMIRVHHVKTLFLWQCCSAKHHARPPLNIWSGYVPVL